MPILEVCSHCRVTATARVRRESYRIACRQLRDRFCPEGRHGISINSMRHTRERHPLTTKPLANTPDCVRTDGRMRAPFGAAHRRTHRAHARRVADPATSAFPALQSLCLPTSCRRKAGAAGGGASNPRSHLTPHPLTPVHPPAAHGSVRP
jgi:hypothetical protein